MRIFYTELDKFKENHSKEFLIPYADTELKTEKRFYEYTIGRFLVKQVAKKYYNIENTEIIKNENGKPVFKNADLHFSISHSKNIVIAGFDNSPCGIDIEFIKERNLNKLSKYFKEEFKTLDDFYKFWTIKEAAYKVKKSYKFIHTQKFKDNYYLTFVGQNEDLTNLNIFENILF